MELQRDIDRVRGGTGALTLAYVDVDGLKATNDSEGHQAGDALLTQVVGVIRTHLRSTRRSCRWAATSSSVPRLTPRCRAARAARHGGVRVAELTASAIAEQRQRSPRLLRWIDPPSAPRDGVRSTGPF